MGHIFRSHQIAAKKFRKKASVESEITSWGEPSQSPVQRRIQGKMWWFLGNELPQNTCAIPPFRVLPYVPGTLARLIAHVPYKYTPCSNCQKMKTASLTHSLTKIPSDASAAHSS